MESAITRRFLPRTEGSKRTVPSILAISAASFGGRASKSSEMRGRPAVMSWVLAASAGDLRDDGAAGDLVAFVDFDAGAGRDGEGTDFLAVGADDLNLGILFVGVLDDGLVERVVRRVALFGEGDAGDHVDQADLTVAVGDDRGGVRVPGGDEHALVGRLAVLDADDGAGDDAVFLGRRTGLVEEADRTVAVHGDELVADGDRA
jgi:hypothetical protein